MKTFRPRVSIIIPVYNGSNYLKEAVDSALAQTYKNLEVIIVNDGSSDGGATDSVAKSYAGKIRYYVKENGGVGSALNFGIERMTGEYFSWLSHDDMYEKTKIEEQVDLLKTFDQDVIIACNARVLYPSGVKKNEYINKGTFNFIDIFLATSAIVGVNGCSLMIPKKALVEIGSFNVELPVTQDYDLWFRLKDKYKFVLLERNLVISRRHPEQDSEKKKRILFETGDQLHYSFLTTITQSRFEDYFEDNKNNIKYIYENYKVYKSRGYNKTASMILKNVLGYYYKTDRDKFFKIFNSEIALSDEQKRTDSSYQRARHLKPTNKITDVDRKRIVTAYEELLDSNAEIYPLKKEPDKAEIQSANNKFGRFVYRLRLSIKRDGFYLTLEKIARKIIRKVSGVFAR